MSRIEQVLETVENQADCAHAEIRNGHVIAIYRDDECESPRDMGDSPSTLVVQGSWRLGDGVVQVRGEYWDGNEMRRRARVEGLISGSVVVPLRLDDYGSQGASIRALVTRWDEPEDTNAYIFCDRETVRTEWSGDRAKAREYLLGEVAELDAWLQGECYGFLILDARGDEVESVWGMIGAPPSGPSGSTWWVLDEARGECDALPPARRAGHYPRLGMAVTS